MRWLISTAVLLTVFTLALPGCRQPADPGKEVVQNEEPKKDTKHSGWWCTEHGIPEEICSLCSASAAKEFKEKGDWCEIHDRAKSQCFKCDPSKYERFAAMYRAKYGKEPPRPPEEEFEK